jgi:hypothetical protein
MLFVPAASATNQTVVEPSSMRKPNQLNGLPIDSFQLSESAPRAVPKPCNLKRFSHLSPETAKPPFLMRFTTPH